MLVPRTGVLGAASLGSLRLGAPLIWAVSHPTARAHAIDGALLASASMAAAGARSALDPSGPRSTLGWGAPSSSIGTAGPEGSVE